MIRKKNLTKSLAIVLSVAMLGTSLQPAGAVAYAMEEQETAVNVELADVAETTVEEAMKEDSTVAEESTVVEETEVVEETIVAEETTVVEETQVAEETIVAEETTVVEETQVTEETIVVEETEVLPETEEESTLEEVFEEPVASLFSLQQRAVAVSQGEDGYRNFTSDKEIASFAFGGDINKNSLYSASVGYGFSDVDFNTNPKGWSGNVYYPRVANVKKSAASYVTNQSGMLAINSKVWTETESSGYGVYTYENTSTFDIDVYNADYQLDITFANPTSSAYTAYVDVEDITRKSGINVNPGKTTTVSVTASVVDGQMNIKFLGSNNATNISSAGTKTVYVSGLKVIRKATNSVESKPTIFIASDSTVQTYEDYNYPQTGWGQTLAEFFAQEGENVVSKECTDCNFTQSQTYETKNIVVENRAIGGRSSKSYIEEGKLDDLLEDIKPGDYLFIQWGHNDATAARPNRYVASSDFKRWIQYYVDGANQRGATPVLVTPVARYSYSTKSDGSLNTFVGNFEAYGDIMRSMAKEQGIALIDLTKRSIAVCNNFGIEGSKSLFLILPAGEYPNFAGGSNDATHLQYYGAYKFAQCVAQGIVEDTSGSLESLKKYVTDKKSTTVPGSISGLLVANTGATSVSLSWNADANTELYYVYRAEVSANQSVDSVVFDKSKKYSVTPSVKYTDSACAAGKTYVYAIAGFNDKGIGEFSNKIKVTTKTAGQKFDFNYNNSPTMSGWIGVNQNQMYSASLGYGWISAPNNGRHRSNNGNAASSAMADDFCLGGGEFAVDLPNGDYEVTVYAADLLSGTSTIKPSYTAEGVALGSISCKQSLGSTTNTVRVMDGQLNVVVGGTNQYINGITVTELLRAPSGFMASEKNLDAVTGKFTFLLGFNPVSEAAGYRIYQKSATDDAFKVVKDFTAEDYANDDLACRAMSVDLGQTYQYYLTCYKADGAESAPSETVTVEALVSGVPQPAAPTNVRCTDPTESENELQHSITIEWDAAAPVSADVDQNGVQESYPVIKYIIYRSDRAEGSKGFSGFVKVGESTTTSYTDTDSVATNLSYYYKVAASNAGGAGKMSVACKTPVVGKLVTGGTEKYTDRALVAINLAGKKGADTLVSATDKNGNILRKGVYLSWRAFESDVNGKNEVITTFDVYRDNTLIANDITVTNLVDEAGNTSSVYKVVGSNDNAIGVKEVDTKCWSNQYLELNLFAPADAKMPDGSTCTYEANDMSVGDLNGDGDLELIVKWYPSNAQDNSKSGYTGKTFLDGYDVNFATGAASLMWRIDMGVNIRSGAHYTQFQVWDYDCDGKAEIAVKTADGTTAYKSTNGTATGLVENGYVGACSTASLPVETISKTNDYRNSGGYVLDGPEYFTIFNGEDGSILDSADYTPARGSVSAWGDGYGNRVDRFLSATAYLDGRTPYAVFARGYYTRTCVTAYYLKDTDNNGIGDTIAEYWAFDSNKSGTQYEAQGNHGLSVNDVDSDGKDEIIYGALVLDHDGTVKYSTSLGHGDAMHVSDWVSWNEGLEIMSVHEHSNAAYQVEIHDAETGRVLMGYFTGKDTGRGVAADIDPTAEGAEFWSIASPTYEGNDEPSWDSTNGEVYSTASRLGDKNLIKLASVTPASNGTIFWDGDLLREIQDHTFNSSAYAPTGVVISKWNYETEKQESLLYSKEIYSINGTKGNVGLVADIIGDWREEMIAKVASDKNKVRIYATTIQTDYVVPCLLENLAYREGVAWQNVGYNQPANLSYLLSTGLVTAELGQGNVTKNSVELYFTPANDGAYGHDIEGYEIYRAKSGGQYELIDSLDMSELKKADASASVNNGKKKFFFMEDFEGSVNQFSLIKAENTAYEYWQKDTATVNKNTTTIYGVGSRAGGDTGTQTTQPLGIKENVIVEMDFRLDGCSSGKSSHIGLIGAQNVDNWLSSDKQILAILATASGNGYWGSITVNGIDITQKANVSNGTNNGESSGMNVKRDTTGWIHVKAELNFASQKIDLTMTRISNNSVVFAGEIPFVHQASSLEAVFMSAGRTYGGTFLDNIEIYRDGTVESNGASKEQYEIKREVLFEEAFEGTTQQFELVKSENTAYEYWEKDTATVNKNTTTIYGVGARDGGDTGTQTAKELGVKEYAVIEMDIRMDACASGKGSNIALLGEKNTNNWLSSEKQILTIGASASGNGYWGSITVNGIDIKAKANINNGTNNGESSGKRLRRDTTGWIHVTAALDFATQTIDLTMTRISDNSVVFAGEVPFVHQVDSLETIFMGAGKYCGGTFLDNIKIYRDVKVLIEEEEDDTEVEAGELIYTYTDAKVEAGTQYSYKIAAIVDGKTSHMSRALSVKTGQ